MEFELAQAVLLHSCRLAAILGDPGIGNSAPFGIRGAPRLERQQCSGRRCAAHGEGASDASVRGSGPRPGGNRVDRWPAKRGDSLDALIERVGDNGSTTARSPRSLRPRRRRPPARGDLPRRSAPVGIRRPAASGVLAIEDLHRADPATLDLIEYLLRATAEPCPCSSSGLDVQSWSTPDRPWDWRAGRGCSYPRCRRKTARRLINGLVTEAGDAREGLRIEEAAEGNPLFIEQLVLMLHEARAVSADESPAFGRLRRTARRPSIDLGSVGCSRRTASRRMSRSSCSERRFWDGPFELDSLTDFSRRARARR